MVTKVSEPRLFLDLARLCQALESTSKRNEKIALIGEFLESVRVDEIALTALFLTGKAFPESDPRVLEVSYASISEASRNQGQSQLSSNSLTIVEVFRTLEKISAATGSNSRLRKQGLLQSLLTRAGPVEVEFLTRMLMGEMRIGVVEGVLMDSIADASAVPRELVRRATMLHGDIGDVAKRALTQGARGLEKIDLKLFTPVKPMLAEMGASID